MMYHCQLKQLKELSRLRESKCRTLILTLFVASIAIACNHNTTELQPPPSVTQPPSETTALKIWWEKGFTLEEDEALKQVVSTWEKQSHNTIQLTFYTTDELPTKTQRAMQAGNPPDIMMSHSAERILNPRLAWEGKLADVSDVIKPIQTLYPASILETVHFYNNVQKQRSYYGVPISQATLHIFYWRDLLSQIGRRDRDIPQDWNGFWAFWKQVQDSLQTKQKQAIYGLGFPVSVGASDTYYLFEQILEAYNVQLLDPNGQLLLNDPKVRQGIIDCLSWYTQFYKQSYIPPEAVNWLNPDNNRQFLNRAVVMTPNATLSIPAAVQKDSDLYHNKLGIVAFPNKPNGQPMRYLVTVKQAVILADSKHQQMAKDFLAYLVQPKILGNYLKAAGGRNFPVLKSLWKEPFWTNSTDPHLFMATKILTQGQTRSFYSVQNPAYSVVQKENVWGKALHRIVVDGLTPEQAADEAIKRIEEIFEQWQ